MKNLQEQMLSESDSEIIRWDIFQLWDHRLACWDSQDKDLIKLLFWWNRYSLLLTDPPYGINYVASKKWFVGSTEKHIDIQNDWFVSDANYAEFTSKWLSVSFPYIEKANSIYIFNSDKMLFALREWMNIAKVHFSQLLIWIKNSAIIGRLDYLPQHELIVYWWLWKHKFRGSQSKSILTYAKTKKNNLHPTMKPIWLLRELILNSSNIWDVIFDPFSWSGSTLIACEQTARKCITIEIDPIYCSRIIKRWETLTWKTAIKVNSHWHEKQ